MPFWHRDYFELKITENQQMQEEFSALSLSALKQDINFPLGKPTSPRGRVATLIIEEGHEHQDEFA